MNKQNKTDFANSVNGDIESLFALDYEFEFELPGRKRSGKQWKISTEAVASRSAFEVQIQWRDQW